MTSFLRDLLQAAFMAVLLTSPLWLQPFIN